MKNYRIVRITAISMSEELDSMYEFDIELIKKPYKEQLEAIQAKKLKFGNGFTLALKSLNHDVHDILSDIQPLQFAWANENNVSVTEDDEWISLISLEQIKSLKPEVVFCQNAIPWSPDVFKKLKTTCPSIQLIVVYIGFPQLSYELYSHVDLFLGGVPFITEDAARLGINAHTMYQSFDSHILDTMNDDMIRNAKSTEHEFIFTGMVNVNYRARHHFLKRLLQETSLECWISETVENEGLKEIREFASQHAHKKFIKRILTNVFQRIDEGQIVLLLERIRNMAGGSFGRKLYSNISTLINPTGLSAEKEFEKLQLYPHIKLSLKEQFNGRVYPPVFGVDMYRLIQGSKITFNKHVYQAKEYVGNMRLFECTGVGTCLLTDTGVNMYDIFEADIEVVTYNSVEEAIEKSNYLLNHEEERKKIALAGQKRTLKDHTVFNRAQQMDQLMNEILI